MNFTTDKENFVDYVKKIRHKHFNELFSIAHHCCPIKFYEFT